MTQKKIYMYDDIRKPYLTDITDIEKLKKDGALNERVLEADILTEEAPEGLNVEQLIESIEQRILDAYGEPGHYTRLAKDAKQGLHHILKMWFNAYSTTGFLTFTNVKEFEINSKESPKEEEEENTNQITEQSVSETSTKE